MPFVALEVVAAILSLLAGSLASNDLVRILIRKGLGLDTRIPAESYGEKLTRLTKKLDEASGEVDEVLAELSEVARNREASVRALEAELSALQDRERQLQERITHLEKVPLPVAEHFAKLTSAGEKRSAIRDYMLFGAGVVVSTVLSILLKYFDLA